MDNWNQQQRAGYGQQGQQQQYYAQANQAQGIQAGQAQGGQRGYPQQQQQQKAQLPQVRTKTGVTYNYLLPGIFIFYYKFYFILLFCSSHCPLLYLMSTKQMSRG
jgi:hypothetical protein